MMIMTMRMRLTKSLMKLEEQNSNTINNNMKGSQLMTFRMNFVIQLRMIWKLRLKLMFMNLLMSMLNK
jgi:hypothetical protein